MSNRRLFIVRIVKEAYVLAPDAETALKSASDIRQWEDLDDVEVESWDGSILNGWDDDCYVYGDRDQDIKLSTAKKIHELTVSKEMSR